MKHVKPTECLDKVILSAEHIHQLHITKIMLWWPGPILYLEVNKIDSLLLLHTYCKQCKGPLRYTHN